MSSLYLQVLLLVCVLHSYLGTKGDIINLAPKMTADGLLPEKEDGQEFSILKQIPPGPKLEADISYNEEKALERKERQIMVPPSETTAQQNEICKCQTDNQNTVFANNEQSMHQQNAPMVSSQQLQINPNDDLLKAERINKGFERMLQFVTVAGQIDNYVSDRARAFIQTLAKLVEDDNGRDRGYRRT